MITIISPTTTMDFNKKIDLNKDSIPFFIKESNYLIDILKTLNLEEVKNLMNLSDDLANLNISRYKNFGLENNPKSQSILAFDGEVFNCMNVSDFNKDDFEFVNNNFRILSGLYGVLSPFDLIEPYRLEMKSKLTHNNCMKLTTDHIGKLIALDFGYDHDYCDICILQDRINQIMAHITELENKLTKEED